MDYKELLKKYWFIIVVGVLLLVFVIAWSIDSNKNEIKTDVQTKIIDGKYSLFEIDGNAFTADDFYDVIDTTSSMSIALDDLMTIIANKEVKSTEEIKTLATNNAQYYVTNYTTEQLEQLMRQNGLKKYGNITTYFETMFKKQELLRKFYLNHDEDILTPYIDGKTYKKISHILIKVSDVKEETDENGNTIHVANPTEEETKKLNEVKEALKTKSFAEVAKKYSEDGSASLGGLLCCCTDDEIASKYVKEFADGAASLKFGQQSDVITSQYGYHIILVEEPTHEDILSDQDFLQEITNSNSSENYIKLLKEYSEKYNIEIVSDDIREIFDNYTNNGEEETETEESK